MRAVATRRSDISCWPGPAAAAKGGRSIAALVTEPPPVRSGSRAAPGTLQGRFRSARGAARPDGARRRGRTVTEGAAGITIGGSRTPRLIGRDSPASPYDPATRERRDAAASARCLVWMTSRARARVPFHRSIRRSNRSIRRSWRFTRRSMRRSCRSILRSCRRCIPRVCIRMMAPSANLAAWRAGRGVVTTAALAPFLVCWTSPSPRPSHRPSGAARARRPWPEGIEPSGAEVEEDRTQPHPLGAGNDWAAYARPCLGNPHRPDKARDAPAAFR